MNSTQSNKTARFRFLIKYLKLKVVLQIVYSVSLLLAPKLTFYMSTIELLFSNFKDAAFILRPSIQSCFAIMPLLRELGRHLSDYVITNNYASITVYQKALIRMAESNRTMKWLL